MFQSGTLSEQFTSSGWKSVAKNRAKKIANAIEALESRTLLSAGTLVGKSETISWTIGSIVADPKQDIVYIADNTDQKIIAVNTDTGDTQNVLQAAANITGLAVSPDDSRLYVAESSADQIQVFSLSSNAILNTLNVGVPVNELAALANTRVASITNTGIEIFDGNTGKSLYTETADYDGEIKASLDGTILYSRQRGLSGGTGDVRRWNVSGTGAPVALTAISGPSSNSTDYVVDPSLGRAFLSDGGIYGLTEVNLSTNVQTFWPFLIGPYGYSVAELPGSQYVYGLSYADVEQFNQNGVVLNTYSFNPIATEDSLVITPNGNLMFAGGDGLSIIGVSNLNVTTTQTMHLVYHVQPTSTTIGNVISPPVIVYVEDSNNALVTSDDSDVTLSIDTTTASGALLTGTLTEQAINGVATFSNLAINQTGTFTLKATDGSLTSAQSDSFKINPPLATKLAFDQPPTGAFVGNPISPPVKILVENTNSETVTTDNSTVTVSIATGPAGAVLGGTLSVQAVDGVATFNNLTLNTPGPYTLMFTDGSLASVTSSRFSISAFPATKLAIGQPPTAASAGSAISPAITVLLENSNSQTVLSADSTVIVSIASGPAGAALGGTLSVQAVDGVATFSDLTLDTAGAYTLKFTDGSLTSVTSDSFNITATVGSNPFAVLSNGILTITGTATADTISVADSAGSVVATLNGTASSPFAASEITGGISITGGAGNDTISVAGIPIPSTIGGAGGDDCITGGAGNDSLKGGAGNDTIGGAGGDDTIVGGGDDDSLKGGDGNDFLAGGPGNDTLHGCVGNDSLVGGAGDDQINGNAGDDTIVGAGSSQLFAGPGNDSIAGNATSDESDSIYCGSSTDTILAGTDDQIFDTVQGDQITGGQIVG